LAERIKKQQFNLKPLTGKATSAPDIWAAVLSAWNLQSLLARQKHTLKTICTRTVQVTYLHELGHCFGWDEGQVADVGLE
jgi:hypothetical protein